MLKSVEFWTNGFALRFVLLVFTHRWTIVGFGATLDRGQAVSAVNKMSDAVLLCEKKYYKSDKFMRTGRRSVPPPRRGHPESCRHGDDICEGRGPLQKSKRNAD